MVARDGKEAACRAFFVYAVGRNGGGVRMGRTVPTYRMQLVAEVARWQAFRRALRVEDQAAFDALFGFARVFADAGSMAARACPSESIFLSMLLGLVKELEELRRCASRLVGEPASEGSQEGKAGRQGARFALRVGEVVLRGLADDIGEPEENAVHACQRFAFKEDVFVGSSFTEDGTDVESMNHQVLAV